MINKALGRYLGALRGPRFLVEAMKYAVMTGGKRLRPMLTIESARALRGNAKRTLPFACAVELIHNFSLIHDDLPAMDNDDTRRGKPACHKKFGEALAILAGDGLLNLAFGIISETPHKKTREITSCLSEAVGVRNMIGGQALDIKNKGRLKKGTRFKKKVDNMKTAALMASACEIGALAAEARPRDIKEISEFGKNLGCAFQITDDIEDSAWNKRALEEMKKEVKKLISKGKNYILPFGKRAGALNHIADSILKKAEKR